MTRSTKQELSGLISIGIDIGKNTFHLVGFDGAGNIVLRRKIKRLSLVSEFKKLPRCVVGMEACMSAHFVSRTLRELGFEPRIIPAKYTKPFVKGQKNDYNDAEAIAEAALRPNLRCVREKTQDQLDLQALHRVRFRLVSRRTATINQIRAFLIEQGIAVRTGAHSLRKSLKLCFLDVIVASVGGLCGVNTFHPHGRDFLTHVFFALRALDDLLIQACNGWVPFTVSAFGIVDRKKQTVGAIPLDVEPRAGLF